MIVCRADANDTIGYGRLFRCIAAAQQLQAFHEDVTFVSADEGPEKCLANHGFTHIVMHTNRIPPAEESDVFASLLSIIRPKCLLIDSRFATPESLNKLRGITRLICFDDLGVGALPADAVINVNAFEDDVQYAQMYAGTQTRRLLGLKYAPVREAFIGAAQKPIDEAVSDILLRGDTFDESRACARLASKMAQDPFFGGVRLHIAARQTDETAFLTNRYQNVFFCGDDNGLRGLAAVCDLAVAADGAVVYELLACGIPAILFGLEGGMNMARRFLDRAGAAADGGSLERREDEDRFINAVKALFDLKKRMRLRGGASLIDGRGAARIAAFLTGGQV